MSAYTLFFSDYFNKRRPEYIDSETGRLKIQQLARDCGKAWGELPYSEAQVWTEASKKERATAAAAYEAWYHSLTPAQLRAAKADRKKPVAIPGGRSEFKKRLDDAPGNPGRPIGPFFLFLRERTPQITQEPGAKELENKFGGQDNMPRMDYRRYIGRRAGELWNQLSDAEKEAYKTRNREMRDKYNAWKEEYEQKESSK